MILVKNFDCNSEFISLYLQTKLWKKNVLEILEINTVSNMPLKREKKVSCMQSCTKEMEYFLFLFVSLNTGLSMNCSTLFNVSVTRGVKNCFSAGGSIVLCKALTRFSCNTCIRILIAEVMVKLDYPYLVIVHNYHLSYKWFTRLLNNCTSKNDTWS